MKKRFVHFHEGNRVASFTGTHMTVKDAIVEIWDNNADRNELVAIVHLAAGECVKATGEGD